MRKLVWIAPLLAVACMSCAGGGDEIAKPEVVKSADITRQDEGVTSRYYHVDNPYTLQRVEEVRGDDLVRSTVQDFEDLGYACEPGHSFVAEGEGPEGRYVEIVALTMTAAGINGDVVYVLNIRDTASEYVVPLRVVFADDPPNGDSYRIAEGVWVALAGEPAGVTGYPTAAKISWNQWTSCVISRIIAGATACAWTCRLAGGMYLSCLATCTQGHAMFALVYCMLMQL